MLCGACVSAVIITPLALRATMPETVARIVVITLETITLGTGETSGFYFRCCTTRGECGVKSYSGGTPGNCLWKVPLLNVLCINLLLARVACVFVGWGMVTNLTATAGIILGIGSANKRSYY